jgi:hypothetical protein
VNLARFEVTNAAALPDVLAHAGLRVGRPVVLLIGGAARLERSIAKRLAPLFDEVLPAVVAELDGAVVDGGTDAGVMRLAGQGWASSGATQPLVGVAARATVDLDGTGRGAQPEPRHTHLLLVPGTRWGDERPWLIAVARALADGRTVTALLVNGGPLSRLDAEACADAGFRVVIVAGSGRVADALASSSSAMLEGQAGRVTVPFMPVPLEDPDALRVALTRS